MKIAIVTDAWRPQVNGVVRTYENTGKALGQLGHNLCLINPEGYRTVPCPTYPSIRLAVSPGGRLDGQLREFDPDAVHIATEGPLGYAARSWCLRRGFPFTTSFHTQFPEYIRLRAPVPVSWSYALLRRFHHRAERTLVPSASQRERLMQWRFKNVVVWPRGVDTDLFRPQENSPLNLPGPVFMYMGRVAVEKNIEAFLKLDLPGTKVVVGDGPDSEKLKRCYPDVVFTGFRFGEELVSYLASADVFVFPSLTDTFGIVLLEAMACGVPVAAYPVTGPVDVVRNGVTGVLDEDLQKAAMAALELDPAECLRYAHAQSWRYCTEVFVNYLAPVQREPVALEAKDALTRHC